MDLVPITEPDRVAERQRPRLRVQGLQGLPGGWWSLGTYWLHPSTPQTNGKLERYHQTLKRDVNQLPYEFAFGPGGGHRGLSSATTTTGAITRLWET